MSHFSTSLALIFSLFLHSHLLFMQWQSYEAFFAFHKTGLPLYKVLLPSALKSFLLLEAHLGSAYKELMGQPTSW